MQAKYDVVIVGAGPAGLFAAEILSSNKLKVAIVDKGRDIKDRVCPKEKCSGAQCKCVPCNIYSGLGGAGGKSDGKLNFHPQIGGDLTQYTDDTTKYIDYVDKVFTELSGVTEYSTDSSRTEELIHAALKNGMEFTVIKQKHIGSDRLFGVMERFKQRLMSKGVDFMFLTNAVDIIVKDNSVEGVVIRDNGHCENLYASKVLLCPGREGSQWFKEIANKYDIELTNLPIDIGVRVETLNVITKPVTDIQYDPKIKFMYKDALVRNFCTNPEGFVVTENYGDYSLVNGHSEKDRRSENCNFAILYRVNLTKPRTNTTEYGMNIAKLFNHLGCQKPIVQRLSDLKMNRRSTEERMTLSNCKATLKDAVPGDITLAMPEKIMRGILEYLERLDTIMPGIYKGNNTLLYGPEIKFQSMRGHIDKNMESSVNNLYLAGDGCGLTGSIVSAAVTGILAAEGILREKKI